MILYFFTLFFIVFGVIYWAVGMLAARTVHTQGDYFLAGRGLGFLSLTGTLVATQLGGGMILGTASESYRMGFPGISYSLGMCGGFMLLAAGFAATLRSFNVSTTAELFEQQYGSVFLRRVASLLSILSLIGIFIGQVVASKSLLAGLGLQNEVIFLLFWGSLVWYTMRGGLPAVVATDILQVVIILTVFCGLFGFMIGSGNVHWHYLTKVFTWQAPGGDTQGYWVGFILMPVLFSLVEQDLSQRFFAAKSKGVAMLSAFVSSLVLLFFAAIPVYLGIHARMSGVTVSAGENPMIVFLASFVHPSVYALVICALIAAIASTADSLLCAISSNVVQDFATGRATEEKKMSLSRMATGATGAFGVVGAYIFGDILPILTQSYELLVSSILVSVLACFTRIPRSSRAAIVSVACGFSAFFFFRMITPPFGLMRSIASLLVSGIGYVVGYVWSQKSEMRR